MAERKKPTARRTSKTSPARKTTTAKSTAAKRKTSTTRSQAAKPAATRSRTRKPATTATNGNGKFEVPADAQRANAVTPKEITWLSAGIPAGMISTVAGRPGQGKSMFTAWLAAEVSKHGDVIFSNLEDARAEVSRPRLEAAGARLDRIHFWTPDIESEAGLHQLRAYIENFNVKLITLDPISAHVKASIWNDQAIRQVLSPFFENVLQPTGCAAVILAHTTKKIAKSAHPLEAIGGSGGGLVGASRAVFVFGPNPAQPEERILATAKSNAAKGISASFELEEEEIRVGKTRILAPRLTLTDPDAGVSATAVLSYNGDAKEGEGDPVKTAVATEWLTSYLMSGPAPAVQVKTDGHDAGFTWTTIRRAGQENVGVVRTPNPNGPGQLWQLPDGHPALTVWNIAKPMFDAQKLEFTRGEVTAEDVLRLIDADKNGKNGGGN